MPGKLVNVVTWDGRTVSVPEEDAANLEGSASAVRETPGAETTRASEKLQHEQFSGVGNALAAGVEGALDTATFGGYGAVFGGDRFRARAEEHPYARMAGEAAGFLIPGSEFTAPGIARGLGEAAGGGRVVSRAVEGGVLGLGSHVAQSNVTGDPLTIEGFAEDAGIGSILNVGLGSIADQLHGAGLKAKAKIAATEHEFAEVRQLGETAGKGQELFSRTPDSYKALREAQAAEDSTRLKQWNQNERANEDFADFLNSHEDFGKLREGFNKSQNKIREGYVQPRKTTALLESNARLTDAIDRAQEVVNRLEDRFAPEEAVKRPQPEAAYTGQPEPQPTSALAQSVAAESPAEQLSDTQVRLKGYKESISRAYQMKGGGWSNDAGKWVRNPGAPADPAGALEELRKVQTDMMTRYPKASGHLRDLPPALPKGVDATTARAAGELLNATDRQLSRAEQLWRGGQKEEALSSLGDASRQINKTFPDVPVPELPEVPGQRYPRPTKTQLPADLEDFARMHPETVGRLAEYFRTFPEGVTDPVNRLADELGMSKGAHPGETIAGIHESLGRYAKAIDALDARAKAAALEEAASSGSPKRFLEGMAKAARNGAAYGAGRKLGLIGASALGVPWLGYPGGAAIGRFASKALGGAGDALEGSLAAGKAGVQQKITKMISKYAIPASRALDTIRPVTSYLGASVLDGRPDPEKDMHQQAVNRIREVMSLAATAPDAAYTAVGHMGMLGHVNDVGMKLLLHTVNAMAHLAAMAPKDPGIDHRLTGSDWRPSTKDIIAFAHRLEAVLNPLGAVARILSGDGHPAAAETLHTAWPAISQRASEEVGLQAEDLAGMSYEGSAGVSQLFGGAMSGLQEPAVTLALQGLYLPKPQQPQQQPRRSAGRPAAVQSQVAGSSVGALIN